MAITATRRFVSQADAGFGQPEYNPLSWTKTPQLSRESCGPEQGFERRPRGTPVLHALLESHLLVQKSAILRC
jgi:hypothetical protein